MADTILNFLSDGGYFAVVVLMFVENVFPPIPSEVILPLVGLAVAEGTLAFVPALACATIGSVFGGFLWYALGLLMSKARLERFLDRYGVYVAISPKEFKQAVDFFTRFQVPAVLLGRMLPTVRTVISLPAGSIRMPIGIFLVLSTIGTIGWNTLLMSSGFLLSDAEAIQVYLDPIANTIFIVFIGGYLLQVIRFHVRRHR